MIGRKAYSTRNRSISWSEIVLRCCFLAIVALFLLLEGGMASVSIPVQKGNSLFFLSDQASHHADCSKPVPLERESRDEGESETDSKDETSELSHGPTTGIAFNFHSGKLLFFQLRHARESRTGISLIILHHCWKSFPH
jgi:hypothetical protein